MRLDDLDPSNNARDLGRGGGGGGFGGGGSGLFGLLFSLLPMLLGRKLGCGTILLIGVIGFFVMSSGMLQFGNVAGGGTEQASGNGADVACDTASELESCRALTSLEQTWGPIFAQQGAQFRPASLNFFSESGNSGCGAAQAAMGPFYCPADEGIYIDTSFYRQMEQQMGAAGDAARLYVIAHEYGHHIQKLTGVADQVRRAQARASKVDGNELQVRMELQADCYAGVWVGRNADRVEPGDLEEGMRAANAIGDDTLMRQAGQSVRQENFTHGSSEQRMRWLRKGIQTADAAQCDTFATAQL